MCYVQVVLVGGLFYAGLFCAISAIWWVFCPSSLFLVLYFRQCLRGLLPSLFSIVSRSYLLLSYLALYVVQYKLQISSRASSVSVFLQSSFSLVLRIMDILEGIFCIHILPVLSSAFLCFSFSSLSSYSYVQYTEICEGVTNIRILFFIFIFFKFYGYHRGDQLYP